MEILKAPRQPVQRRSKERVKKILDAADEIITESGWGAATSHVIAKRAGVPPAGVYHFFPDRYMIYDALISRHAQEFLSVFNDRLRRTNISRWQDVVHVVVKEIADYCRINKTARELSYGCDGEFATRWSSSANNSTLADMIFDLYGKYFEHPDVENLDTKFQLVAEFMTAGFTHAVAKHDPMDQKIVEEMRDAVIAYMATWVGDPVRRS
ncbi:MAG: TetR/AcrR family transcriptional regulator [Alphaproteobacteria bacterium]|nr:MAG: TetR/AcrR family transcriptional regulator [Alphaproteobacteria bacterium]